jgi:hypothetical protein
LVTKKVGMHSGERRSGYCADRSCRIA